MLNYVEQLPKGANLFCFLSSFPLLLQPPPATTVVFGSNLSSSHSLLLITNTVSPMWACLLSSPTSTFLLISSFLVVISSSFPFLPSFHSPFLCPPLPFSPLFLSPPSFLSNFLFLLTLYSMPISYLSFLFCIPFILC
jgi:hypothetical protein